MTERLYYDDSHTTDFTAQIVERTTYEGHPAVVLDRTYFYPTGGGQPHDTGTLGGVPVIEVVTREGDYAVLHILDGDPPADDTVACAIDWARRFDHMQHHTGQHILTQAFVSVAGANTVGFHLGADSVTIDLDKEPGSDDRIAEAEELANRIIYENRPVTPRVIAPEEAEALGARIRRIPGHLSTDGLRVVEVEDFDLTACGGTHVAHTGEIGGIHVLGVTKHRDGVRVEFRCGWRALHGARQNTGIVTDLSNLLTVGGWELADAVTRLQNDYKAALSDLRKARGALVNYEADEMLAALVGDGPHILTLAYDDRDAGDLRALASRLIEHDGVIVLAGVAGEKTNVIAARSADLDHNMNPLLQAAFAALGGGRGGGRPDFAQGGGEAASREALQSALEAAAATLAS